MELEHFLSGMPDPPSPTVYSESSRQLLVDTEEEARGFGHNYISSEHLLLGLIRNPETRDLLVDQFGITLDKVRHNIFSTIGRSPLPVAIGLVELSPRIKEIRVLTLIEAVRLGDQQIYPRHFLLALLRKGEGLAIGILESMKVDLVKLASVASHNALVSQETVVAQTGRLRDLLLQSPEDLRNRYMDLLGLMERDLVQKLNNSQS